MAETVKKTWLKDDSGQRLAPASLASVVFDKDGNAVEDVMVTQSFQGAAISEPNPVNADTLGGTLTSQIITDTLDEKINYTDSLTLEEILASTDLSNKVASASSISDLNQHLADKLTVVSASKSVTVNGNSQTYTTIDYIVPSGYSVVSITLFNDSAEYLNMNLINFFNDNCIVGLWNHHSSALTRTIKATILCVKF